MEFELEICSKVGTVASLSGTVGRDDQEVLVRPLPVGNILSWRFDHEIFSMVILSHPLIQEGQSSVSGKRICTHYMFFCGEIRKLLILFG